MRQKKRYNKNIFSTLLLVFILLISYFITSVLVNEIVTESCYKTLGDAAAQMAVLLDSQFASDREQLEVIAGLLASHADMSSLEAQSHLASYRQRGMISSLVILLSDDEVIISGEEKYGREIPEFAEEVKKVPYVSGVYAMGDDASHKYIYQAIPIESDGETIGILYGIISLETLKSQFSVTAFNDTAQLFVIDGSTGDFIIDTWHDVPGNVQDEALSGRKLKSGGSINDINDDILAGGAGHFAFRSLNAKKYFYACYMPAGINRWSVMITVPESEAFASAERIRYAMYFLATVDVIALFVYFLWMLSKIRNEALQKERQLQKTLFMFDIQQTLFDSYRHPERIYAALEKTAGILTAETVFLVNMEGSRISKITVWPEQKNSLNDGDLEELLSQIGPKLLNGETVLHFGDGEEIFGDGLDQHNAGQHLMRNLMVTPVLDSEQHLTGFMGAANMQQRWENGSILEGIARTFLMAQNNVNSYQTIQRMGMWDALTGLKNRNSYQSTLKKYVENDGKEKLGCIYIDVNGLHELNNHLGHAAGDEMLRFIGSALSAVFGKEDVYRIGGDEFVVFCRHMSKNVAQEKLEQLNDRVASCDYHLSAGLAWQERLSNINLLIADAEQEMYEEKRRYYQEKGDAGKYREMNRKLEQILLEKRDSDTFLSIISSYFKGIYVVNLDTDGLRVIYKPSYFAEQLKVTNYKFIAALRIYAESLIYEEDRIRFLEFLDYEKIGRKLQEGCNPQLQYRKKDGTKIILRVYPALDYAPEKKETLWLFEETE